MTRWKGALRSGECEVAIRTLTLAVLTANLVCVSYAAGNLNLEGVYTENKPCGAKGGTAKVPRVVIRPNEILHAGGVCAIDSRRQEEKDLVMQVTCKFQSGAVMVAEIALWRRDDATLGMEQRDGNYKAVLYKCSE